MASVYTFISELAKKSGIDISGEEFSGLSELTNELPDSFEKAGFMSLENAKKNTPLKTHFVGQFVDGVSQNISTNLDTAGFTKEQIDAVFEEKNFTDRLNSTLDLFKNKKDDGKDSSYKTRISALEAENLKLKTESEASINSIKSQYESERIEETLVSELMKQPWSDSYPMEDRADLAKIRMNKFLASNPGAKLVRDAETRTLKIVDEKNIDMGYFDSSNKEVTFEQAITSVIAPFKKVSDQTDTNANTQQVVTTANAGQSAQSKPISQTQSTIDSLLKSVS